MATTIVPKPGKIGKGTSVKGVQTAVHEWLESAQADWDHCSSVDDGAFYQGQVYAFQDVLWHIELDKNHKLLHKSKLFAIVPVAIVVAHVITTNNRKAEDA